MSGFQIGDQNEVPILNPSSLEKHCVLGFAAGSSATTQPKSSQKNPPFSRIRRWARLLFLYLQLQQGFDALALASTGLL
jgi:hypothetical protein